MPDLEVRDDVVGVISEASEVFDGVNAEVGFRLDERLRHDISFDEESIITDRRYGFWESCFVEIVGFPVEIVLSVSFPQPPAQRVVGPEEREVS